MSGGDYERWVTGVRAWRDDPSIDLSGLPALTSASFTPATYERLFTHVQQAIQAVMDAWNRRLTAAFDAAAGDPHLIGRALVELRRELGRRLQLARLAGWPEEIRIELEQATARDIRDLQAQLERNVGQQDGRTGSDRSTVEMMLRLLRENSLTAVLDPRFDLDRLFSPTADVAPAKRLTSVAESRSPTDPVAPASRPARRIAIDS